MCPDMKSIEFLNEVARYLSIVIRTPKAIQIKTLPEDIYIYKEFLKDSFKKAQVFELHKNKLKKNLKI